MSKKYLDAKAQRRKGRILDTRQRFARLRLCVEISLCFFVCFSSCKREERKFSQPPAQFKSYDVTMSDIHPGSAGLPQPVKSASEEHAYDTNEGKRLFTQYNCSGCHANGGGGMGPPLIDAQWIYGSNTENIYSTIVEGRPNGMPSFRQKIPDAQLQQIVAYVKSLSGQLRKDVEPGRTDNMNAHRSEQRTERKTPQQTTAPPYD